MNKKLETLVILLALPSINIHAAESDAVTRHVANNGIDSSSCGTSDSPCRSITRAILNAGEGDTILVGPGRYGDLNADGDFNDPGDELRTALGIAEGCAVCIDKGLNVISTDGAEATVIDAATPTEWASRKLCASLQMECDSVPRTEDLRSRAVRSMVF